MTDSTINPADLLPNNSARVTHDEPKVKPSVLSEQTFRDQRRQHFEGLTNTCKTIDHAMLTLPAGALALSMTFMKEIVRDPKEQWLLVNGWYALGVAIIFSLLSLLTSQESFLADIDSLDQEWRTKEHKGGRNGWSQWTRYLNWAAIGAFLFGLFETGQFAAANLH